MEGVASPPASQNRAQTSSFLSPLIISMGGIVATSVAIIIYHLFLVKYCLRRRRQQQPATTAARAVPVVSAGVEKKVLDAIPVLAFSAVKGGDQYLRLAQEECIVCLGELEDEDLVRLLPNCKHAFHVRCIDQWFLAHTSCPLCRSPILTQQNPQEISEDTAQTNHNPDEEDCYTTDNMEPSLPSTARRSGLLRHCMSLELPHAVEMKSPPRSIGGLNRSISMDPSFAVINIQNEGEIRANNSGNASSSSRGNGKLKRSESYRTRPVNQIDRMSSKLRTSFSRLRLGKGSQVGPILPY